MLTIICITELITLSAKNYTYYRMDDSGSVVSIEFSDKFKVYEDVFEADDIYSYDREIVVAEGEGIRIILNAYNYIAWSVYDMNGKIIALGGGDGTYDPYKRVIRDIPNLTFDLKEGELLIDSPQLNMIQVQYEGREDWQELPIEHPTIMVPKGKIDFGDLWIIKN